MDYEIGLINLKTYFSFPNIDSKNNKLIYYSKTSGQYEVFSFDTWAYDIKKLYSALKAMLETRGDTLTIKMK